MASLIGGVFLAYLLSVSFTDQVNFSLTSVQKLVDYQYNLDFRQLVPGEPYNGSISVVWAIPQSAISRVGAGQLSVKITATADPNSTISFPSASGTQSRQAEAYLRCDVENGACANTSVLSTAIKVIATAKPDFEQLATISLKSELVEAATPPVIQIGSLFDSIKGALGQNNTSGQKNGTIQVQFPSSEFLPPNTTNRSGAENFLDSLKPAGDSKDPIEFLRGNPVVSLTALVIVIIITGAYLLKAKD